MEMDTIEKNDFLIELTKAIPRTVEGKTLTTLNYRDAVDNLVSYCRNRNVDERYGKTFDMLTEFYEGDGSYGSGELRVIDVAYINFENDDDDFTHRKGEFVLVNGNSRFNVWGKNSNLAPHTVQIKLSLANKISDVLKIYKQLDSKGAHETIDEKISGNIARLFPPKSKMMKRGKIKGIANQALMYYVDQHTNKPFFTKNKKGVNDFEYTFEKLTFIKNELELLDNTIHDLPSKDLKSHILAPLIMVAMKYGCGHERVLLLANSIKKWNQETNNDECIDALTYLKTKYLDRMDYKKYSSDALITVVLSNVLKAYDDFINDIKYNPKKSRIFSKSEIESKYRKEYFINKSNLKIMGRK